MQIKRFKRKSNGLYTVYFDTDVSYDFWEEIILKYELLLKKKISEEQLLQLQEENKKWDSYYTALNLINKIAKTKKELQQYLLKKGYSLENSEFAITCLEKQGYLNDNNYAKSYAHQQIIATCHGPRKIIRNLEEKGISKLSATEALEEYTSSLQQEKINKIISRKIQSNHNKSNKILKNKIINDLLLEGFDKEIIEVAVSNTVFSDDLTIAQKEYVKNYQKLSRKYEGKELEYKLKQKMYALGFSDFTIEEK